MGVTSGPKAGSLNYRAGVNTTTTKIKYYILVRAEYQQPANPEQAGSKRHNSPPNLFNHSSQEQLHDFSLKEEKAGGVCVFARPFPMK